MKWYEFIIIVLIFLSIIGQVITYRAERECKIFGRCEYSSSPVSAKCNDGTYSRSKTHSGSCSGHDGVYEFYR